MLQDAANDRRRVWTEAALLVLLLLAGYCLIWCLTGMSPLEGNPYNSYSIQAASWLQGRLDVDYYSWLELAEYQGQYFISFPPMPSVVMLPLVAIVGVNTPDHLINVAFSLIGALCAFGVALRMQQRPRAALYWALLVTLASNFMFIATVGWVWFIAQTMSFAFSMASIYCALSNRRSQRFFALLLLAAAVGCRPFQLVFAPVIIYILYKKSGQPNLWRALAADWYFYLPPLVLGGFYAVLNYLRFDNPLEFGHNYLPEFVEAPQGQFHPSYIWPNVVRSFRLFEASGGSWSIPRFNGWATYLVMPVYVSCLYHGVRGRRVSAGTLLVLGCIVLNLLATWAHRTMGGFHFGNRYLIDATPFVLLATLWLQRLGKKTQLSITDGVLLGVGSVVNLLGTILFWLAD